MRDTIKEIRRFEALDDDANPATIVEYQIITFRRTINGRLVSIPTGPVRFALADGSDVNHVKDKTYQVVATGKMLRDIS